MAKTIPLTQGYETVVDDEDYDHLSHFHWHVSRRPKTHTNYAATIIDGHPVRMHQLLVPVPKGFKVDHKDGDGLNNRRSNLRVCTHGQNMMNRRVQRNKTASTYKGVYKRKKCERWSAYIRLNRKTIHLGSYGTEIEAARAYDTKARELFGEFARLNFPGEGEQ